jgi:hypothetical protein
MTDHPRLEVMAHAAAALGRPDATQAIVRECLACVPTFEFRTLESSCH